MTHGGRGGLRKEGVRIENWLVNRQNREMEGWEWAESKSNTFWTVAAQRERKVVRYGFNSLYKVDFVTSSDLQKLAEHEYNQQGYNIPQINLQINLYIGLSSCQSK